VSDPDPGPADNANAGVSVAEGGVGQQDIVLDDPIIDLTDPEATWLRVERDLNPFERLDKPERMRLMIRVLCELVAFDEVDEDGNPLPEPHTETVDQGAGPANGSASAPDPA
jgi:hypothetical protein